MQLFINNVNNLLVIIYNIIIKSLIYNIINPFVLNAPFLYYPKTSENLKVF